MSRRGGRLKRMSNDSPSPLFATVTKTTFGKWPDAIHITNGVVEVVVVPVIGRVMSFQFVGEPDSNPIWVNPESDPEPIRGWVNYGGDKLWPSLQDHWGLRGAAEPDWPPCDALDGSPFIAEEIPNGLRVTSPLSGMFAVRVRRDIVLGPAPAKVTFHEQFIKSDDASQDKHGFPMAIWNITQIRADSVAYIPMNPSSRFGLQGHITLFGKAKHEPNCKRHGDLLEIRHNPDHSTKFGADAAAGWIGALYGDTLFTEYSVYDPNGRYLDCGTSAQVWTNDAPPYMELELQGPGHDLLARESMSRMLTWDLQRLPRRPVDAVDARSMVSAATAADP
jgi:hypothetical protein